MKELVWRKAVRLPDGESIGNVPQLNWEKLESLAKCGADERLSSVDIIARADPR